MRQHNSVRMLALCVLVLSEFGEHHSVYSAELTVVKIASSNGDEQPARCYFPVVEARKTVPLLVVLHSWSGGYDQKGFAEDCLKECEFRTWAMIHPHFRGPNVKPEACASELAVQDVLDAVAYAKKQTNVDEQRIYLAGTSGGGHMSLIMAGRHPHIWAGVSAWVPISDLAAWHAESIARKQRYAANMEAVCGGKPGDSPEVDKQYRNRSPLTWLDRAKDLPIDINTGIDDGHTGSVPVSQSLIAFNLLAALNGHMECQFPPAQIEAITVRREIAEDLAVKSLVEPGRKHKVLIRREAGSARVTIFQGGHEGDMPTAIRWLAQQVKPGR